MTGKTYFTALTRAAVLAVLLGAPAAPQRALREVQDKAAAARMQEARRRAELEELRRLNEKMAAFVRAWNEFTEEYAERGTFNLRKARSITKAWRSLEREETWPKK